MFDIIINIIKGLVLKVVVCFVKKKLKQTGLLSPKSLRKRRRLDISPVSAELISISSLESYKFSHRKVAKRHYPVLAFTNVSKYTHSICYVCLGS